MCCNSKRKFQYAKYMCCALGHVRKMTMGLMDIGVSCFGACDMTCGKAFSLILRCKHSLHVEHYVCTYVRKKPVLCFVLIFHCTSFGSFSAFLLACDGSWSVNCFELAQKPLYNPYNTSEMVHTGSVNTLINNTLFTSWYATYGQAGVDTRSFILFQTVEHIQYIL